MEIQITPQEIAEILSKDLIERIKFKTKEVEFITAFNKEQGIHILSSAKIKGNFYE